MYGGAHRGGTRAELSRLVTGHAIFALVIAVAFLVQWIAFVPAYLLQTERFYDLTGSLTYILVVTVALLLAPPPGLRSIVLWALVVIWAARLGTFLFVRVRRAGKDSRFDTIKLSFPRFLTAWTTQGLWVSLTLAPALAAIIFAEETAAATPPATGSSADAFLAAGLLVWVAGFAIEVVADAQKRRFRADRANKGRFISTGLWAWSRHPNYFGEIVLWTGTAIIAFPVLQGWQLATLISPVFVYVLLTRISGVPLLERKADATWGGDEAYERYKAATPVLWPRRPG